MMFAPCEAASLMSFSAFAILIPASAQHAICVAATVTFLISLLLYDIFFICK